ncbi:MAG: hypothetical protein JO071_14360 [Deltaproteobacteria bacterium]|nr:hypothetical protein [Deltaproteobacteria bacterium]
MNRSARAQALYVIDSLDGEVTKYEVDTFISGVAAKTIRTSQWASGAPPRNKLADFDGGTTLEGLNDLYAVASEIPSIGAGRLQLLNLAIKWNDAWLTHRNDQPLGEHRVMWTGKSNRSGPQIRRRASTPDARSGRPSVISRTPR